MRSVLMLLACCAPLAAQDAAAALQAAREKQMAAAAAQRASVTRQDGAAAALAESVARQRAAVERQLASARPAVALAAAAYACEPLAPSEAETVIGFAAAREGLPRPLLRAVMERESAFRPCAVSRKGALGLMQLMPATAFELGVADAFDPVENASSGARLLSRLLARYGGDVELALGAYNAGPARVDAAGGVPDIPETRDYVEAILSRLGAAAAGNRP